MTTYYLQDGTPENHNGYRESRMFLDDHRHNGCVIIRTYSADTWIDARMQVPA